MIGYEGAVRDEAGVPRQEQHDGGGLLHLRGIRHTYGGAEVLRGIDLALHAGEVVCLLGPSGCGKSTLLRIAAGVERQTGGEVAICGRVVSDARHHVHPEGRAVGLMFQDFALFPHLTVLGNVAFGLRGADRETRAMSFLDRVGLAAHAAKYPHQLSGGEQQRVALARAIAPRPAIFLMDEPFSGLDNRLRDGIRDDTLDILKEEETAVLLVTHEPEEAMRMADRIVLMRAGAVVQQGAPYAIYTNPVDKQAAMFFSDVNVVRGIVRSGCAETPFGAFPAAGLEDGGHVEVVIRPQHLRVDFDRNGVGPRPTAQDGIALRGTVVRARFMGDQSLIEIAMDADGAIMKATLPGAFLPRPGTALWLAMRRDRSLVFPAALPASPAVTNAFAGA